MIIWKGKFKGQVQKWFITRFLGQDEEINLKTKQPEFIKLKNKNKILKNKQYMNVFEIIISLNNSLIFFENNKIKTKGLYNK